MRSAITNRFREQVQNSGENTTRNSTTYNWPSMTVRSTSPIDFTVKEYDGYSYYYKNQTWDCVNTGYWAARRRGQNVNNDYVNVKTYVRQRLFTPKFTRWVYDVNGQLIGDYQSQYDRLPTESVNSVGNPLTVNMNIDYIVDKAVTALHARISSAPMQSLVTLGELKQTMGLVRSLLSKTHQMMRFGRKVATSREFRRQSRDAIFRRLEKGPVKNASAFSNRASRQWLEYRYGIRQLYYDYSSAAKAMRAMDAKPRQRYTAFESDQDRVDESVNTNQWTGQKTHTLHRSTSRQVTATAGALVEARKSSVGFIQAFGLDEVFQAAWDLTRFSFIVDWFINVGEKIAALAPKGDVDIVASWVKVVDTVNHTGYTTFTPADTDSNIFYTCEDWDPWINVRTVQTTRLKNPAVNPIPNWDIRLNVGKIVDLLAILRTLPVLR